MAVPGPSTRTYTIDDNTPSAQVVTTLIVGDPGEIGALELELHDLTGPASTAPVILPVGFTTVSDVTLTFQPDVGGSIDPTAIFHVASGASRTFAVTFVTGWTFSSESYIFKVAPKTSPKLLSLLDVSFRFTGAATIT